VVLPHPVPSTVVLVSPWVIVMLPAVVEQPAFLVRQHGGQAADHRQSQNPDDHRIDGVRGLLARQALGQLRRQHVAEKQDHQKQKDAARAGDFADNLQHAGVHLAPRRAVTTFVVVAPEPHGKILGANQGAVEESPQRGNAPPRLSR